MYKLTVKFKTGPTEEHFFNCQTEAEDALTYVKKLFNYVSASIITCDTTSNKYNIVSEEKLIYPSKLY